MYKPSIAKLNLYPTSKIGTAKPFAGEGKTKASGSALHPRTPDAFNRQEKGMTQTVISHPAS